VSIVGVFHLQKISENFYWEFPFGKSAFHLSQIPFVHRPLSVAIFSNTSFFVAFPPNKCLLSAYVVIRSLTSASSYLSRFTVVETSPVNEELQKNFSELIVHATFYEAEGNVHRQKKVRTSKNFYLPLLYAAHSCCNKFSRSGARTWQAEHS
jgi:hypothetical protein